MSADPAVKAGEAQHPGFPAAPQTQLIQGAGQPTHQDPELLVASDAPDDDDSLLDGYDGSSSYGTSPENPNKSAAPHVVRPAPPPLNLVQRHHQSVTSIRSAGTPNTDKPLPKSPGDSNSKLSSFFGWGVRSPTTPDHNEQPFSPIPSSTRGSLIYPDASPATLKQPPPLHAPGAPFGSANPREYVDSFLATPPSITPGSPSDQIEEMEDELKVISTELAASIRREMDLEDLVDKLQAERDNPTKRTSDYFSDSGYSSAKFSDFDASREEMEKMQRRAEQEMAQVKLDLTNKVQSERLKRQQLDEQVKELSEKAAQIDLAQLNSVDATGRVKELEATCETLRRKLSEEIKVKDNFEDLLSALKGELQSASNERDNLRDEIVPQLRARVEGLEGQATELEKMTYATTKMQQELQALKFENDSLKRKSSMGSISEDPGPGDAARRKSTFSSMMGLSRSNSVMASPSSRQRAPPAVGGLSRSKSVKSAESREQLSDRLKDVEEQRDALHRALKSLLERQEHQDRENEKKIRALEMERDRLMTASPQKAGFVKEVSNLRDEINTLRRRSEEALEQKWQVEKGLAGLKMDLDRAEQEIASLKSLLQEKDILIPEALARASASSDGSFAAPVTSESLVAAYADLQAAYASALDRIKNMEPQVASDEKTMLAIEKLEQSLAMTVSERDAALQEASAYQEQVDALKAAEQTYLNSEKSLGDEVLESSRRVEELAVQVRQQLASNQDLRSRLRDTVARGEAEHKTNTTRITDLQARLRILEEQLVAVQSASEERITRHEEEVAALKVNHNDQLSRLSTSSRSPRSFSAKSPLSPLFAASLKSPGLGRRAGAAEAEAVESEIKALKSKVAELEKALTQADLEMEVVVSRMNTAQIEVLQLQEEREAAVSQTRKLERQLQAEKVKAFEGRFKLLQS